jgi:hypothetical protein
LKIESYFRIIQDAVDECAVILVKSIQFEKRGTYEGYINGLLHFYDNTELHFREFVDVQINADCLMYSYHYIDDFGKIIFRYDNTGHHKKLNLPTFPHHKHVSSGNSIIASNAPNLKDVLQEIEMAMILFSS